MSRSAAPLFTPFALKGLTLPNRIVMAPMTRSKSPGGVPGEDVAGYYARRAANGVGLIVTEGTTIAHPVARNDPAVPDIHGEAALAGWKRVVDKVHAAGGRIFAQLWHVGLVRKQGEHPHPHLPGVGPSGISRAGKKVGEPMTVQEIEEVVAAYAQGASDARRLGFDGVELHGAHGYLIDQFFWSTTNLRADRYGGATAAERTAFAVDVLAAVRQAVGPDFPVALRWSQWKSGAYDHKLAENPRELEAFLAPLVRAGVDIFHCSQRRFWVAEFPDSGSHFNLAGWTKKVTGRPTVTVGSVGLDEEFVATFKGASAAPSGIERLLEMYEEGQFDLVAVGRALLVDPAWVLKVQRGEFDRLLPYTPDALQTLS